VKVSAAVLTLDVELDADGHRVGDGGKESDQATKLFREGAARGKEPLGREREQVSNAPLTHVPGPRDKRAIDISCGLGTLVIPKEGPQCAALGPTPQS
jgi:hypothetical protein